MSSHEMPAAPSRTPSRVPFTDARRVAPARRFCRACHRDKTGASFAPGEIRCRKCVRDGTSNPEIRVTLRQVGAAAIVLRRLRQIAAGRLDAAPGCPTIGVDGLRALAAEALRAVEEAR